MTDNWPPDPRALDALALLRDAHKALARYIEEHGLVWGDEKAIVARIESALAATEPAPPETEGER